MLRVFPNGPGDRYSIPGLVIPKTKKMLHVDSLLNTQHYKARIKDKWRNLVKGVVSSLTPWCSSNRKGSLRVTLDYGLPTKLIYIYISLLLQKLVRNILVVPKKSKCLVSLRALKKFALQMKNSFNILCLSF